MPTKPSSVEIINKLTQAEKLCRAGDISGAKDIYEKLLIDNPSNPDILSSFGTFNLVVGEIKMGLEILNRSLQIEKNQPQVIINVANTYMQVDNLEGALDSFTLLLELDSKNFIARLNRGFILARIERHEDALKDFDFIVTTYPERVEGYLNRSASLRWLKRFDDALEASNKAIILDSKNSEVYYNKALILSDQQKFDESEINFKYCLKYNPKKVDALVSLGFISQARKKFKQALNFYDLALQIDSSHSQAKFNKSLIKLNQGDYKEGWALYETRFESACRSSLKSFNGILWNGKESIEGKQILIYAEQGLGDSIQFVRYLSLLKNLGAKVIFDCPKSLIPLMKSLDDDILVVEQNSGFNELDYFAPLMSLPFLLNTTIDNIPNKTPYLFSDKEKKIFWKNKLGNRDKYRVGLVWSGGLGKDNFETWYQRRNIKLETLSPLKEFDNIDFISLQKGSFAETELKSAIENHWEGPEIKDFTSSIADFSDTAALIDTLDLILSVDTSTAHLAAAMNKKTWILDRFDGDWRWFSDGRIESPWYPSVRLFRQSKFQEGWEAVIKEVVLELKRLTSSNT